MLNLNVTVTSLETLVGPFWFKQCVCNDSNCCDSYSIHHRLTECCGGAKSLDMLAGNMRALWGDLTNSAAQSLRLTTRRGPQIMWDRDIELLLWYFRWQAVWISILAKHIRFRCGLLLNVEKCCCLFYHAQLQRPIHMSSFVVLS